MITHSVCKLLSRFFHVGRICARSAQAARSAAKAARSAGRRLECAQRTVPRKGARGTRELQAKNDLPLLPKFPRIHKTTASHEAVRSRKCNLRIRSAKKWVGRSGRSGVYPFSLLGRSVGEF